MDENFTLEIRDFGKINEANIEINKINVIGGVNASGKSTASKLLYCFLKAISQDRDEYILPKIIRDLNLLINYVEYPVDEYYKRPGKLSEKAHRRHVLKEYEIYKDNFQEINNSASQSLKNDLHLDSILPLLNALDDDNDNLLSSYCLASLIFEEYLTNFTYEEPSSGVHFLKGNIKFHAESFESIIHDSVKLKLDDSREVINVITDIPFDWDDGEFYYLTRGSILINNVFYIGNVSIFDLESYIKSLDLIDERLPISYEEHMDYLICKLSSHNYKNPIPENIAKIQERIENIIEGNFQNGLYDEFSFSQEDNFYIIPINISSGIKQIGIIQLLLENKRLIPGCFLIIDEPEVNLHPEWQFRFAEILVMLAKELDITVYLNSHSPMFIEAIDAFTEFYDMGDDVNYYLTERLENEDKYNFTKIGSDELYKLYDNLGNGYKLINELRLKKRLNG